MNTNFTTKQPHYHVELITASDLEGEPFYAYLLLPENHVGPFRENLGAGQVELEKYGIVLASGKGHTPSREHVDYIRQRFEAKNS